MASFFQFCEYNGAESLGHGTQPYKTGVANTNWLNLDSNSVSYATQPITAGNNSFDKFQFGLWSGNFNNISSVLYQHVSGLPDTSSITLKFYVSGSGLYRTPAITTSPQLAWDATNTGLISTGYTVKVGQGTEPAITGGGFGASSSGIVVNPYGVCVVSQFLGSQLVTSTSASPGDITPMVFQIQWVES